MDIEADTKLRNEWTADKISGRLDSLIKNALTMTLSERRLRMLGL